MKYLKVFGVVLIVTLICLRLALPHFLLRYVENQINQLPDYRVKIADLDVHLIRGAYTIKKIQLWKIQKNIPVPFFEASIIDFSIDWKALFHGKVVAKILVQKPNINFVTDPSGKNEQLSINKQWLDIVKSLYPLNINKLEARNGNINLISYSGSPPFKIYLSNAHFLMQNMQKATHNQKLLSSSFEFTSDAKGGGNVAIYGSYDPFAKTPVFDMQLKLTSLKVAEIGNFLRHYTALDVAGGIFSLYGEVAAANGKIEGYIKPFIKALKIAPPKNNKNPLRSIIDGTANVVAKVLKNSKNETIATQINISGKFDDPNTSILSIIGYLLRHGFIQALIPRIDHSIKAQDLIYGQPIKSTRDNKAPQYRP